MTASTDAAVSAVSTAAVSTAAEAGRMAARAAATASFGGDAAAVAELEEAIHAAEAAYIAAARQLGAVLREEEYETDCGGFPISGTYFHENGEHSWGPCSREDSVRLNGGTPLHRGVWVQFQDADDPQDVWREDFITEYAFRDEASWHLNQPKDRRYRLRPTYRVRRHSDDGVTVVWEGHDPSQYTGGLGCYPDNIAFCEGREAYVSLVMENSLSRYHKWTQV